MARAEDGELWFESEEATEEQARAGAAAARAYLVGVGVDVRVAVEAFERNYWFGQAVLAWEQGKGEHPDEATTGDDEDLLLFADGAWQAALAAAGVQMDMIGMAATD